MPPLDTAPSHQQQRFCPWKVCQQEVCDVVSCQLHFDPLVGFLCTFSLPSGLRYPAHKRPNEQAQPPIKQIPLLLPPLHKLHHLHTYPSHLLYKKKSPPSNTLSSSSQNNTTPCTTFPTMLYPSTFTSMTNPEPISLRMKPIRRERAWYWRSMRSSRVKSRVCFRGLWRCSWGFRGRFWWVEGGYGWKWKRKCFLWLLDEVDKRVLNLETLGMILKYL